MTEPETDETEHLGAWELGVGEMGVFISAASGG